MSLFYFEGPPGCDPKVEKFINWSMRPFFNMLTHFYYEGMEYEDASVSTLERERR